jgi:hypothetical protein
MARLLRPGGICAVSFLTIDEEAWAQEALEGIRQIGPDGHFGATHARPYVSAQADAMVRLAGFELLVNRHGDPARDTGQPHYNVVGRLQASRDE